MESEHLQGQMHKILPAINASGSDSAMLDNTLEFLVMSGMPLPLAEQHLAGVKSLLHHNLRRLDIQHAHLRGENQRVVVEAADAESVRLHV